MNRKIPFFIASLFIAGLLWTTQLFSLEIAPTQEPTQTPSQIPWNTRLSSAQDDLWKKRVRFEVQIDAQRRLALREHLAQIETPAEGMQTTLAPLEFRFRIGNAPAPNVLPLVGARAEEIRVAAGSGKEHVFEILDEGGDYFHSGVLREGMSLVVPIELATMDEDGFFFVYFDNSSAWELPPPEWWSVRAFSNGSFERNDDSRPAVWTFDVQDEEHKISLVRERAYHGDFCIRTEVKQGAELSWIGARQKDISVRPGQKYRLSGWTKGENVHGYAGWFIHIGNARNGMVANGMLSAGGGTFEWKETSQDFEIPEGCDRVTIGTVLRGTGVAWADSVDFRLLHDPNAEEMPTCVVSPVENLPLDVRYPSRVATGGAPTFDPEGFFAPNGKTSEGKARLPRFAFVRVVNDSNERRSALINVQTDLCALRWDVDISQPWTLRRDTTLDPRCVRIFDLNGEIIPYSIWNGSLFIEPQLLPNTVHHFVVAEGFDMPSRYAEAQRRRAEFFSNDEFPGTSLQHDSTNARAFDAGTESDDPKSNDSARFEKLPAQLAARNLVANPGFEEIDARGLPLGWHIAGAKEGVVMNLVAAERLEFFGKRSAHIQFAPRKNAAWEGFQQMIPITPGRNYFCGMWMKTRSEGGSFSMHIHFFDKDKRHTASNSMTTIGKNVSGSVDWTLLSGSVRAPLDAEFIQIHLTTNHAAEIWYDEVFLVEMESASPQNFQGGDYGWYFVPSVVKVLPDTTFREKNHDRSFVAHAARNEEESVQIAFRTSEDDLLAIGDSEGRVCLKGADSSASLSVPYRVYAVGYVPTNYVTSYYNVRTAPWLRKMPGGSGAADGWKGYWSDPLIPLEPRNLENLNTRAASLDAHTRSLIEDLQNRDYQSDSDRLYQYAQQGLLPLRKDETRALWIIFDIPADAQPGEYVGEIRCHSLRNNSLQTNSTQATILPLRLEVHRDILPDEPVCGAIYDIRTTHLEYWNEQDVDVWKKNLCEFMARKGLAPDMIPIAPKFSYSRETQTWSADWAEFDAACEWYFGKLKVRYSYVPGNFYLFGWGMPPRAYEGENPYNGTYPFETADKNLLRPEFKKVYQEKLRLFWNHVKEKGWDDRFVLYISDEPFYWVPHIIDQMKACCAMIREVDPNIPIYASTWRHIPEWDGFINVWGVGHYGIVPEKQLETTKARNDRIWWTTDGQMCTDTPYCATERLLPYWCVKYGADAYEFWGVSWYTQDPYRFGWHSFIHQSDRPGVEYYVRYPNGDGYLVYPDKLLGANEIISSIRLEQAREGVEDAASLKSLEREIERVEAMKNLNDAQRKALQNAKNTLQRAFDMVHIPHAGGRYTSRFLPNPQEIDDVRSLVLRCVDALKDVK
ncbi:MAG: DUF4091 domain-containing protein [Planctomycetia bacterium]|nr:DUF4091 domain-containing protein [Planctomycetia bacterium]